MVDYEPDPDFARKYEQFHQDANEIARTMPRWAAEDIFAALQGAARRHGMGAVARKDALWRWAQQISKGDVPAF